MVLEAWLWTEGVKLLGLLVIPDHGTESALEAFPVKVALIVAGSLIVPFCVPLNEIAVPVFVPSASDMLMLLAVASLVAVPALPETLVCNGCEWSDLAHSVDVPAEPEDLAASGMSSDKGRNSGIIVRRVLWYRLSALKFMILVSAISFSCRTSLKTISSENIYIRMLYGMRWSKASSDLRTSMNSAAARLSASLNALHRQPALSFFL